jgi:hypothetical protein
MITITDMIDAVNNGEELPEVIDHEVGRFDITWHSTDAWRGYYKVKSELEAIESTWGTGNWDDAPSGHAADDMEAKCERIDKELQDQGSELVVVLSPTSNVFSMGFDLFKV